MNLRNAIETSWYLVDVLEFGEIQTYEEYESWVISWRQTHERIKSEIDSLIYHKAQAKETVNFSRRIGINMNKRFIRRAIADMDSLQSIRTQIGFYARLLYAAREKGKELYHSGTLTGKNEKSKKSLEVVA